MSLTLYERIVSAYKISDEIIGDSYSFSTINEVKQYLRRKISVEENINIMLLNSFRENYFLREYFVRNLEEKTSLSNIILEYLSSSKSEIKEYFRDFKELFPISSVVEKATLEGRLNFDYIKKNSSRAKLFFAFDNISYYSLPTTLGFLFSYFSLNKGFDLFSLQTILSFPLGFLSGIVFFKNANYKISEYFQKKNPLYYFYEDNFINIPLTLKRILNSSNIIESLLF